MKINFSYDPGTTLKHMTVFEMAGKIWSSYLKDDVTLNLHVGVTESKNLPQNVIGGALPAMRTNVNYQSFRQKSLADASSWVDNFANKNLDETGNQAYFEIADSTGSKTTIETNANTLNMTRANAKALGLTGQHSSKLDGYILMSDLKENQVTWNTESNSPIEGKLDLLSTALHEVGHALGFISGVDQNEALPTTLTDLPQQYQQFVDATKRSTTLDQFRFSNNSNGVNDLSYGDRYSDKFFSIHGGDIVLGKLSSGSAKDRHGDGFQASHWDNYGAGLGIMDPTLSLGERPQISLRDLKVMDAIGWDMEGNSPNQAQTLILNYKQLRNQARADLAARAGKSTTWISQNQAEAASLLSEVRVADVVEMAVESQVYDLSWMNAYGGASYWLNWAQQAGGQGFWLNWWNNGGGNAWWQTMDELFQQQSLFATLDENLASANTEQLDAVPDAITGLTTSDNVVHSTFDAAPDYSVTSPVEAVNSLGDSVVFPLSNREQKQGEQTSKAEALQLSSGAGETALNSGLVSGLGLDQLMGVGTHLGWWNPIGGTGIWEAGTSQG